MKKNLYFNVCKNLIYADLIVFKQALLDKFIDVGIWVILTNVVMGYVMQFFGLHHNFGPFQFGGLLAAVGLFELFSNAFDLIADFEGNRVINYSLSLPIPSKLVLISKVLYYSIVYLTLSLLVFPMGKLSLWNQLDLMAINYPKLLIMLIVQNIFYGCFLLWVTSIVSDMSKLSSVWSRFIFPMWIMGGFQFSWIALYGAIPLLALANLINPMIYITEGLRAALLGQAGYINFWLCIMAAMFFSVFFLAWGMHNLKQRLDFV